MDPACGGHRAGLNGAQGLGQSCACHHVIRHYTESSDVEYRVSKLPQAAVRRGGLPAQRLYPASRSRGACDNKETMERVLQDRLEVLLRKWRGHTYRRRDITPNCVRTTVLMHRP